MLSLIPLLPFVGFLINTTLGRRLPKKVSGGVATAVMALTPDSRVWMASHRNAAITSPAQPAGNWLPKKCGNSLSAALIGSAASAGSRSGCFR